MKKRIKVVAAIIENENNEILCALRSLTMSMPNLWEFPGGKVEEGEDIFSALQREISEELDCSVECTEFFSENTHEYESIIVNLVAIKCRLIEGKPIAREHAKLIWLDRTYLNSIIWAPADIPIVEKLIHEK